MSQQLTPISNGVVPRIETTTESQNRLKVFSPQYVSANNLESRPTEWVAGGRPIYRRLPATSETYQIDFFNVVAESNVLSNNVTLEGIELVGYVYIPYGLSINGSVSCEVVASDSKEDIFVKAGKIVWQYGQVDILPTIINLRVLDVASGKYEIAYQLVYDDSPVPNLYEVADFSLAGLPLDITSSSDNVIGWRYPVVNAFINTSDKFWSNEDSFFPSYAQPSSSFIQWESELPQAYSTLTLRCPPGTAYTGTASLFYISGTSSTLVSETEISFDTASQFFRFDIEKAELQNGWRVEFSQDKVAVESITVSGSLTLLKPQAGPSPRATLVMYARGTLPKMVENSQGVMVPASYCKLAEIDVDFNFSVIDINDTRTIIHRDYVPVANWLTAPFDENLIDLYEQVSDYESLWMSPPSCMTQEYAKLSIDQITVES